MQRLLSTLGLFLAATTAADGQQIRWKGDLQPITAEQIDAFLRVATIEADAREAAWRAQPMLIAALRQQRCIDSFEARAEKLMGPPEMVGDKDDPDDDRDNIKRLNRDITAKCGVKYPEEWKRDSPQLQSLTNWRPLDVDTIRTIGWDADHAGEVAAEGKGGLSAQRYAMLKERLNAWSGDPDSPSRGGYVYDASEIAAMKPRLKQLTAIFARLNEPPMIK